MIILDTNVLCELMRPEPNDIVLNWINQLPSVDIRITAISVAEVLLSIAAMPQGKRKVALTHAIADLLDDDFLDRVLPFDASAAAFYAELMVVRTKTNISISNNGAQIAAICLQQNARLATRNILDFQNVGITVIDPWRTAYAIQQAELEYLIPAASEIAESSD